MSKPSRDEVLEVLGEPLAIVYVREEKTPSEHGRFTSWLINPVGIHNGTNLYTEAQALALAAAMYAAGEEGMRERAANEAGRMMMYPGGRCEAPAHDNVWAAAKAILALPITTSKGNPLPDTEGEQG